VLLYAVKLQKPVAGGFPENVKMYDSLAASCSVDLSEELEGFCCLGEVKIEWEKERGSWELTVSEKCGCERRSQRVSWAFDRCHIYLSLDGVDNVEFGSIVLQHNSEKDASISGRIFDNSLLSAAEKRNPWFLISRNCCDKVVFK
jgi:hypothetical protein